MMYCLSSWQPWADLIMAGLKDIENRSFSPRHRGRLLIHASATKLQIHYDGARDFVIQHKPCTLEAFEQVTRNWRERCGFILGSVTVVECVQHGASPWFEGPYGLILSRPLVYPTPIPFKARPGVFEVPHEIELEVMQQAKLAKEKR